MSAVSSFLAMLVAGVLLALFLFLFGRAVARLLGKLGGLGSFMRRVAFGERR